MTSEKLRALFLSTAKSYAFNLSQTLCLEKSCTHMILKVSRRHVQGNPTKTTSPPPPPHRAPTFHILYAPKNIVLFVIYAPKNILLFAINNERINLPHPPTLFTHRRTSSCLSFTHRRTSCCLQSTTNAINPLTPATSFTHRRTSSRTSCCLQSTTNVINPPTSPCYNQNHPPKNIIFVSSSSRTKNEKTANYTRGCVGKNNKGRQRRVSPCRVSIPNTETRGQEPTADKDRTRCKSVAKTYLGQFFPSRLFEKIRFLFLSLSSPVRWLAAKNGNNCKVRLPYVSSSCSHMCYGCARCPKPMPPNHTKRGIQTSSRHIKALEKEISG